MNKNVYVFAEQREGVIQPVALELIGKARDLADVLGDKVVAIFAGHNIADQANELIAYGADDVIVVDAPELKDYVTEQYTQADPSASRTGTAQPGSTGCSFLPAGTGQSPAPAP